MGTRRSVVTTSATHAPLFGARGASHTKTLALLARQTQRDWPPFFPSPTTLRHQQHRRVTTKAHVHFGYPPASWYAADRGAAPAAYVSRAVSLVLRAYAVISHGRQLRRGRVASSGTAGQCRHESALPLGAAAGRNCSADQWRRKSLRAARQLPLLDPLAVFICRANARGFAVVCCAPSLREYWRIRCARALLLFAADGGMGEPGGRRHCRRVGGLRSYFHIHRSGAHSVCPA